MKKLLAYFYFLPAERRAVAILLVLILGVMAAPAFLQRWYQLPPVDFSEIERHIALWQPRSVPGVQSEPQESAAAALFCFDPNTASVDTLVQLGVPLRVAQTIERYRARGGRFRSADDLGKIYTLPPEVFERLRPYVRIPQHSAARTVQLPAELFPFDPNTVSRAEILRLGLSPALADRLLRYREKGGVFRQKSDLQKLYGLSRAEYERLEPYIAIAPPEIAATLPAAYSGGATSAQARTALTPIDINAADADTWMRLPGIGAARAKNILRYRDLLGGFCTVEQVGETFGLPDSVFQQIRSWLRLEAPIYRKINLNTASEAELAKHPYISYRQARLIVAYREQHGPYGSAQDIRRIAAFDDSSWLARIMPYLEAF